MVCSNAASFGMNVFKYTMHILYTRLTAEWSALDVRYPEWLTCVVMDEAYYILALVLVCATCFAVGLIIGLVATIV